MKRLMAVLLAAALMLACVSALAYDGVDEDYETIKDNYDSAIADVGHANRYFENLVTFYNKSEDRKAALDAYKDSRLYYTYASARLNLENGNYSEAAEQLSSLGQFGDKTDIFYTFASGMLYKEYGFYADALECLRQVNTEPAISAVCMAAIDECQVAYKEEELSKARLLCTGGDHDGAQACYAALADMFPTDMNIRKLYKECQGHTDPIPGTIGITNAYADGSDSIIVIWDGTSSGCTVSWGTDLSGAVTDGSTEATENTVTLTGLKPGTMYRVQVTAEGASAEKAVETMPAGLYSDTHADYKWMGNCTMYRFDNREQFYTSGKTSYSFLRINNASAVQDKVLKLFSPALTGSSVLYVFPTLGIPADMQGREYEVALHITGFGTVSETGEFGDAHLCNDSNDKMYLLVDSLFDDMLKRFGDLSGAEYRVDVLMDGEKLAEVSGSFE